MTDHSTARALVKKLRLFADLYGTQRGMPWIGTVRPEQAFAEAADFIEQSLTRPEGDTVSEGVVHVVFDGPPGHESGRFVECETPDGRSINIGQWHERNDGLWELRIPTALQSRVSPQAGMREALERAQSQVGTLAREILREVGAGTCDNWVNALNGIAREINAALSTTPIPMTAEQSLTPPEGDTVSEEVEEAPSKKPLTGDLRQAVATALFDTFSTARLSEHPEQEAEYGGHADSFIGWLGTQGFVVVAAKSMTEIPASIQNITPTCRENRTPFAALEEAFGRIRRTYLAYCDVPDNANVTWRISLIRVDSESEA